MVQVIGKVLGALLRSLFVSIVMFVIGFSVISGEFPPNFKRLEKTYESLQQMSQLGRQLQVQQKDMKNQIVNPGESDVERDVEALQNLTAKRAELGENILTGSARKVNSHGSIKNTNSDAESSDIKDLKARINELQTQVYRLQQRVGQLEDRNK